MKYILVSVKFNYLEKLCQYVIIIIIIRGIYYMLFSPRSTYPVTMIWLQITKNIVKITLLQ